jgi:hypothetical protein
MEPFPCPSGFMCRYVINIEPLEASLAGQQTFNVLLVAAAVVFIVLILAAAWNTKR